MVSVAVEFTRFRRRNSERVVMYTPFERTQIRALREAVPELDAELLALELKLIDLRPVIRNNVFHPDFEGSFSLKYVLPALVPGLSCRDLVIVNGLVASVEIARLLFVAGKIPLEEQQRVRKDLLDTASATPGRRSSSSRSSTSWRRYTRRGDGWPAPRAVGSARE